MFSSLNVPGRCSGDFSLYFTPKEYAGDDWWTAFSTFSTSYEPGAEK